MAKDLITIVGLDFATTYQDKDDAERAIMAIADLHNPVALTDTRSLPFLSDIEYSSNKPVATAIVTYADVGAIETIRNHIRRGLVQFGVLMYKPQRKLCSFEPGTIEWLCAFVQTAQVFVFDERVRMGRPLSYDEHRSK